MASLGLPELPWASMASQGLPELNRVDRALELTYYLAYFDWPWSHGASLGLRRAAGRRCAGPA